MAVQQLTALPSILRALCGLTNMGFAALVRLDGEVWQACAVDDVEGLGIAAGDTWRTADTFCGKVRETNQPLRLADISSEEARLPATHMANTLGVMAYFGYPVYRADGSFFGTLCTMGTAPQGCMSAAVIDAASAFSQMIGDRLRAQKSSAVPDAVRSKVLSVLGHDLRNPMHSLMAAIEMIQLKPMEPRLQRLMGMVHGSAVRLSELARHTLDYARLQTLDEMPLNIVPAHDCLQTLNTVAAHVRTAYPQRGVDIDASPLSAIDADPGRLEQMLDIVLTHAVKHCGVDQPVRVHCEDMPEGISMRVLVDGYILDAAILAHIFDPFYTVAGEAQTAHLGVGLYLAHAMARAHGGDLTAMLNGTEASFILSLPRTAVAEAQD